MTGEPETKPSPHKFTDLELAWIGENLTQLRRSASEQGIRRRTFVIASVIGLAAHVGGYMLRSWAAGTEPLSLVGDLLYTLGWALWTGVVVVLFLQTFPEAKHRQNKVWLDAFEAAVREKGPAWKPDFLRELRSVGGKKPSADDK